MRKLCRVLFSRYAISAVMICLEVVIFTFLCIYALPSLYIVAVICALAAICALISLINRDANPEYKIPWAVIIIMIPALGPLMYLLFYKRRMSKKEAHRLTEIIGAVNSAERANEAFDSLERGSEVKGKARAILNDDSLSGVYRGTNSKLYFSGEELFADIKRAFSIMPGKKRINVHACYALLGEDKGKVDRDAYTYKYFEPWVQLAKECGMDGVDFNPTFFAHPMMKDGLSLSSPDEEELKLAQKSMEDEFKSYRGQIEFAYTRGKIGESEKEEMLEYLRELSERKDCFEFGYLRRFLASFAKRIEKSKVTHNCCDNSIFF